MKSKSKYLVLLLLLLVICGGLTTYALFRTNKSGNATVNAARWNVVFKNGEEVISNNFDISLEDAEWTNELGRVASGKIAPGSSATFYITIDATGTETDVDYTAEIDESFDESDFDVTLAEDSGTIPYSTASGSMVRQIPIQVVWNGNINDSTTKNNDDLLKKARDITIPIKITAAQRMITSSDVLVTFDSNGGTVSPTSKIYRKNTTYTDLPTPVKENSSFRGWNGKNLLDYSNSYNPSSCSVDSNGNVSSRYTYQDNRTWGYSDSDFFITLQPGTYTMTLYFSQQANNNGANEYAVTHIVDDSSNFVKYGPRINSVDSEKIVFTLTETKNLGLYIKSYNGVYKIQVEEGSSDTVWEPYIITSDTLVTQTGNHTLKAIYQ